MPENQPLRVMIADDHDVVREGLAAFLSRQQMQIVAEAHDGQEAVALYRCHQPDITLMDLRMPHMDGLAATRAIVAEYPHARVLVLTSSENEEENSLRAGAKALVRKDAPFEELVISIRAVYSLPS